MYIYTYLNEHSFFTGTTSVLCVVKVALIHSKENLSVRWTLRELEGHSV